MFTDLLRSCASLVGRTAKPTEGPDGVDMLDAFRGQRALWPGRTAVIKGRAGLFGLRQDGWMNLHGHGSGDDAKMVYAKPSNVITDGQLYLLADDLQQDHNRANDQTERMERMRLELEHVVVPTRQCRHAGMGPYNPHLILRHATLPRPGNIGATSYPEDPDHGIPAVAVVTTCSSRGFHVFWTSSSARCRQHAWRSELRSRR